jgi:DHA1 family multidrug resistance protein-like MFS transporter
VRAMIATTLVMGLTGLVRSPGQLLVVRAFQGFFTGTPAAASALVATGSPRERMAFALGMVQTALFVGSSLGPMMGGYVADAYGYRAVFYVGALIYVVCLLLVLVLVTEPIESVAVAARARMESPVSAFSSIVSVRSVAMLIALTLVVNLTFGLIGPVLPIFIQQLVTNPERLASTAGTISGVAAFSAAVAALVIGRLSDKIGHRRVLLACGAGMGLMQVPQAFARSALSLGLLRTAQGLFQGGIAPSSSAILVDRASKERAGAALGLSTSASGVGSAIGPLLGAALLAITSTRVVLLISAALFFAVTLALAVLDHESEGQ